MGNSTGQIIGSAVWVGHQMSGSALIINATILSAILLPLMFSVALAEPPHPQIRKSLIHLVATGTIPGQEQTTSTPAIKEKTVRTFGTGFVVSKEGLVLTTYHLIEDLDLEKVNRNSVKIVATIGEKSADKKPATILDFNINKELLLLKLPPGRNPYAKVVLGSAHDKHTGHLYASGFPEKISYRTHRGTHEASEHAAGAHLWRTSHVFQYGEGGSPVYNSAGKVVGIARLTKAALPKGFGIIPIGFAETLLAQVRVREIQSALKDFDALRYRIDWKAEKYRGHLGNVINVSFEKMVDGWPIVQEISVDITPVGEKCETPDKCTVKTIQPPLSFPNVKNPVRDGPRAGVFEVKDSLNNRKAFQEIEGLSAKFSFKCIARLIVKITPKFSDDKLGKSQFVTAKYDEGCNASGRH